MPRTCSMSLHWPEGLSWYKEEKGAAPKGWCKCVHSFCILRCWQKRNYPFLNSWGCRDFLHPPVLGNTLNSGVSTLWPLSQVQSVKRLGSAHEGLIQLGMSWGIGGMQMPCTIHPLHITCIRRPPCRSHACIYMHGKICPSPLPLGTGIGGEGKRR